MNDQQLLLDILAELRQIRAALGNTSRSSVELSENAKGVVQITVKAYSESPIDTACIEASSGFATMKREVDHGQMTQWAETVADLQAKRAAEYKRIYGSESDGSVKHDLPA